MTARKPVGVRRPPKFVVRCDDFRYECQSRAQAERKLAEIVDMGLCKLPHEIVEVER